MADGFGEVDFVGDTFGHVEIEAHEFGVDEVARVALGGGTGFEITSGVFEGGAEHGTVALDFIEGVIEDVEGGCFADGDGAFAYDEAGVEIGAEADVGLGVMELDFMDGVDEC